MAFKLFRRNAEAPVAAPRPPASKASAVGPLIAMQNAGRAAWTPRDPHSLIRNGFTGNVIGFRCVRMVAEAASCVPLSMYEGGVRLAEHPVLGLLARPNPSQLGQSLLEALYGNLQLHGDAYLEAAGLAQHGGPAELHVLRPDRMRLIPGADGWPVAYEYSVGGRKARFDATDAHSPVLHVKSYHPTDDHYGLSPLQAAAASVDIHNAAASWSKALLDNAARPSGAIVYAGADGAGQLSDDQYRRLTDELETHHQGARNAGRPMLLEGGLDWKPMGFSPSDMEFLQTKNAAARDIALAFGVPPMLLGLPGDNTYANYQEANRAFYRQTVLPLVNRVAGAVAAWLTPWYGGQRLSLTPDLDGVTALAAERDARWSRVSNASFLTDDEKRAELGLPPAPSKSGADEA